MPIQVLKYSQVGVFSYMCNTETSFYDKIKNKNKKQQRILFGIFLFHIVNKSKNKKQKQHKRTYNIRQYMYFTNYTLPHIQCCELCNLKLHLTQHFSRWMLTSQHNISCRESLHHIELGIPILHGGCSCHNKVFSKCFQNQNLDFFFFPKFIKSKPLVQSYMHQS